jgi:2'-5' RNA ligase
VARAFVAVVPPDAVLDAVAGAVGELRAGPASVSARWARREQWHLTLRFLGDHVDLDDAATALTAVTFAAFDLQLGGIGAFARPSRASVLWFGVAAGCNPLIELASAVNAATAGIAPVDTKPYRPHLTVARFATPADVRDVVHRPGLDDGIGPVWRMTELVLVQSRLGAGPADHRVHSRVVAR